MVKSNKHILNDSLIEPLESCVDELIVHVRWRLTISNGSIKLLGSTLS